MKLKKALSLFLTLAMLLGMVSMMAVGVSAAEWKPATYKGTVLYDLYQTNTNGFKGTPTENTPPSDGTTTMTMTDFKTAGKLSTTYSIVSGNKYRLYITISSEAELQMLSELSNAVLENGNNADKFEQVKFFLTTDLDMSNITFTPIANNTVNDNDDTNNIKIFFSGDFDGGNHTISNLEMTSFADGFVNVALFGCVKGGVVQNLIFDSTCSFTYTGNSANARVASAVAFTASQGSFGNGVSTSAVYSVAAYYAYDGNNTPAASTSPQPVTYLIKNIKNSATVTSSAGYAGGIVGLAKGYTSYMGLIMNCTQANDVTCAKYAGGILGALNGTSSGRKIGIVECQVKADANVPVKITGDVVDERTNLVLGTMEQGNYGDFACATLIDTTDGFDYDAQGYSILNVNRLTKTEMDAITDITSYNTTDTKFKITSTAGLEKLAELVNASTNSDTFAGKIIYLANDLDCSDLTTMTTIGGDSSKTNINGYRDSAKFFAGTFDGQGYKIDNLNMTFDKTFGGLFGVLKCVSGKDPATVRNLVFGSGCSFTSTVASGNAWVAPIAMLVIQGGGNDRNGSPRVINCYSAATVKSDNTTCIAAGFVAALGGNTNSEYVNITYCTNAGDVLAGYKTSGTNGVNKTYSAAIIGEAGRGMIVTHCVNTGNIKISADQMGAMVGAPTAQGQMCHLYSTTPVHVAGTRGSGSWIQTDNHCSGAYSDPIDDVCVALNTNSVYAGYQVKDGSTEEYKSVRILAYVHSLDATSVGFDLSINDGEATGSVTTATVYRSIIVDGKTTTAESLGGKYIVAITLEDIPAGTALTIVNTNTTVGGSTAKTATTVTIQL